MRYKRLHQYSSACQQTSNRSDQQDLLPGDGSGGPGSGVAHYLRASRGPCFACSFPTTTYILHSLTLANIRGLSHPSHRRRCDFTPSSPLAHLLPCRTSRSPRIGPRSSLSFCLLGSYVFAGTSREPPGRWKQRLAEVAAVWPFCWGNVGM